MVVSKSLQKSTFCCWWQESNTTGIEFFSDLNRNGVLDGEAISEWKRRHNAHGSCGSDSKYDFPDGIEGPSFLYLVEQMELHRYAGMHK